jgi:hypothetical protein
MVPDVEKTGRNAGSSMVEGSGRGKIDAAISH